MKNSHFLFLFLTVILLFVLLVIFTPTPTNWNFTYSRYDKGPHGSFMLYEELDQIFPDAEIQTTDSTIYQVVKHWDKDNTALLVITEYLFSGYETERRLDSFVNAGNHVFLSANTINFNRADSSALGHNKVWSQTIENGYLPFNRDRDVTLSVFLENSENSQIYNIRKEYAKSNFISDSTFHYKLGTVDDSLTNFIRIPHGEGNYFLFSHPGVFTNNAMLHDSLSYYASSVLSHIPNVDYVLWDEHQKPGFFFLSEMSKKRLTPLNYLLDQRGLSSAIWLIVLGSLLLIFTKGKREQQMIPVIEPPENKSVEFSKTMGRFYHEKAQHVELAKKRMNYFELDFRRTYKIQKIDDFKRKQSELSTITGIPEEAIKVFFQRRELLQKAKELTELQLMQISKSIENMKPQN